MPGVTVGRVSIKVLPDTSDFRKDLKRKLEAITKNLKAEVGATVRASELARELRSAVRDVNAVAKVSDSLKLKVPVVIDTSGVAMHLAAEIAKLNALAKTMPVHVNLVISSTKLPGLGSLLAPITRSIRLDDRTRNDFMRKLRGEATTWLKALSGFRLIRRAFNYEMLRDLDLALPKITGIALAAGAGAIAFGNLSGALFAVASDLARISAIGLVVPGVVAGLAVGVATTVRAMKDFNREVPAFSAGMADIGRHVSSNFWSEARGPIRELVTSLLPRLKRGLREVAAEQGRTFASLARYSSLNGGPALSGWLEKLRDFQRELNGLDFGGNLAKGIIALGNIGSAYLPRLGRWIGTLTRDFASWVDSAYSTGDAFRWIDNAITDIKALGRGVRDLIGGIVAIGDAAKAAGYNGIQGMADGLEKFHNAMRDPRNMESTRRFFKAIKDGWNTLKDHILPSSQDLWRQVADNATAVLPKVSRAVGGALGFIVDLVAHPALIEGLGDMFDGIGRGVQKLRPHVDGIASGLRSFGTYIGEAADALSGPLGTALSGLSRAGEGILPHLSSATRKLAEGLDALLKAVKPVIESFSPKLGEAVERIAESIREFAVDHADDIGKITELLASMADVVLKVAVPAIEDLIDALGSIAGAVGMISPPLKDFFDWLGENLEASAKESEAIGDKMGKWIGPVFVPPKDAKRSPVDAYFDELFGGWGERWSNFDWSIGTGKEFWNALFPGLGDAASGFFDGIKDTFRTGWERVTGWFATGGAMTLQSDFDSAMSGVDTSEAIGEFFSGIGRGLQEYWGKLGDGFGQLWDTAVEWLRPYGKLDQVLLDWQQMGRDCIAGFLNGLQDSLPEGPIKDIGTKIINWVKGVLGIHSPSTVFFQIGVDVVLGLINGILSVDLWGAVCGKFQSLWDGAVNLLSPLGETLGGFFQGARDRIAAAAGEARDRAVERFESLRSGVSSSVGSARDTVTSRFSEIVSAVSSRAESSRSVAVSKFMALGAGMISGVTAGRNGVLGIISSLPGSILGALPNLGGLLYNSGRSLMSGFANGIRSAIASVKATVSGALGQVRGAFPYSPAKWGPFSGRGYTTHSGAALIRDFGRGMESGIPDLASSARRAMGATHSVLGDTVGVNARRMGSASTVATGDSLTIGDIHVGSDDPQLDELKEAINTLRRYVRAHGGA